MLGLDSSQAMIGAARPAPRVAPAEATGLDDGSADVVTISQAFHWMDPDRTLAEAARILVPRGVVALYFHEWPPAAHPDADAAFEELRRSFGGECHVARKARYGDDLRASGRFRYVRGVALHAVEEGDAERLVGLALALGPVHEAAQRGDEEALAAVERLRSAASKDTLGHRPSRLWWSYHVALGVK